MKHPAKRLIMKASMALLAITLLLTTPLLSAIQARAETTPSAKGAKVYFINLKDGDKVKGKVFVQFGLSGMGVAPAGIDKPNTGHHHLIINEKIEGDELKENIPSDETHKHFGGGQTETTLDLKPGTYTLQLVLGDKNHVPHNPPVMSDRITITVED